MPDKIPALVGGARAIGGDDNEKGRFFYALIKTGGAQNLLAIGGGDDNAGTEALDTTIEIIANIRKKK